MARTSTLRDLASLTVSRHLIPARNLTPNTSLQNKPLLIYRSAFPDSPSTTASTFESHFRSVGVVTPQWRYTMYTTSHFHSTTHEVLGIANGKARLCFGGEENPGKVETVVSRGDVLVIPAGVAHKLLEDLEGGFEMVGCYPPEKQWDMCYGKKGEEGKVEGIKNMGWFERDPVYGEKGPVLDV
jgi:uncharacterized protein YjlB